MRKLQNAIKDVLDWFQAKQQTLSTHWRQGANKRSLVVASILLIGALFIHVFFIRPPGDFPAGRLIEVPEGATLSQIAELLKEEGVIRSTLIFRAGVSLMRAEKSVQFGDYLFKEPVSVFSVARALALGEHGLEPIRIRVPEGAMVRELAPLFAENLERFDEERFLRTASSMEGLLFPDTYFFLPNADDRLVLRTLRQNFDAHMVGIEDELAESGRELEDIIIMASILEREAHNTEDRRMIAGVLWKRLDLGLALQVDAVFLYSIGRSTFDLTNEDLTSDSPYNTYKNKGLPPTPIGNPSLDAILAAATPIESDYLFYLADRNFNTYYSETYEEHLEKKRRYLGT